MSDDLLPCPFCGGHASLVSPAMGRPYVCCDDNFCTGPKPSADQAIAAWNRRALPATDARDDDLIASAKALAEWCVKNVQPNLEMDRRLHAMDAAMNKALQPATDAREKALREAADALNERGIREQADFGLDRGTQNFFRARDLVRALIGEART